MSMLDKVHDRLNPSIWGSTDKLLPEVKAEILQKLNTLISDDKVRQVWFIGGNASLQYNKYSDIDISVVSVFYAPEPGEDYDSSELGQYHAKFKAHNESMDYLTGTYHPINYFIMPNTDIDWGDETVSIYLIKNFETGEEDVWYRPYKKRSELRNPEDAYPVEMVYGKMLSNILVNKVKNLLTNLITLRDDKSITRKEFHRRLQIVEQKMNELINKHDELDRKRKFAYSFGWGIPKYGLSNLTYKIMDKEGLIKIMENLEDNSIQD